MVGMAHARKLTLLCVRAVSNLGHIYCPFVSYLANMVALLWLQPCTHTCGHYTEASDASHDHPLLCQHTGTELLRRRFAWQLLLKDGTSFDIADNALRLTPLHRPRHLLRCRTTFALRALDKTLTTVVREVHPPHRPGGIDHASHSSKIPSGQQPPPCIGRRRSCQHMLRLHKLSHCAHRLKQRDGPRVHPARRPAAAQYLRPSWRYISLQGV